jgi:hypothetical protein
VNDQDARVTPDYPKGTPGSLEAIEHGCLCARMDNNNGRGFTLDGKRRFWMVIDCPVHQGVKAETADAS